MDRQPLTSETVPRWVPWVTIGSVILTVLGMVQPHEIVKDSTPTGGDMGAHVLGPALLRDVLLPAGNVAGWSDAWFAGFPAFYFYFPLPSLVIVGLDTVLPYGVAFKVVTVVGLLATPAAAYYLARAMDLPRMIASAAGVAGGSFVFIESFTIYGGNIASTMAGEFSFSWSFALGLFYLGLMIRTVRDDRRYLPLAALVLGLTALAHVITTIMFVLATVPILFWRRGTLPVLVTWVWGFGVSAFWALPLLRSIGFSADMAWSPLRRWDEIFPTELWILAIPAVAGLIWLLRNNKRATPLLVMTFAPVVYFWVPRQAERLEIYDGTWKLWNGRLLPWWYFGVLFFVGVGFGVASRAIARRLPASLPGWVPLLAFSAVLAPGLARWSDYRFVEYWAWGLGSVAVAGIVLVVVNRHWRVRTMSAVPIMTGLVILAIVTAGTSFLPGWARWNYTGYEAKDGFDEYIGLMEAIDELPAGRVQWEANKDLNSYGTPMALMLTPYWSDGHPSMEGLFFESSLTTPFHFVNASEMSHSPSNPIPGLDYHTFEFDRGVEHMDTYGVSYYVAFTDEATEAASEHSAFTELASADPFTVYALPKTSLVAIATHQPAVYEAPAAGIGGLFAADEVATSAGTFHEFALGWYDDLDLLDMWVTADGPAEWPRINSLDELPSVAVPLDGGGEGEVTDIVSDDGRITFTTTAVGVPHIVKMSYFPNWEVEGAEGPFRTSPSLMVVVPTTEDVTLQFNRQWPEKLGWGLSAAAWLGLAAAGGLWIYRRRATG